VGEQSFRVPGTASLYLTDFSTTLSTYFVNSVPNGGVNFLAFLYEFDATQGTLIGPPLFRSPRQQLVISRFEPAPAIVPIEVFTAQPLDPGK
jgi:hypothetical protein